jgi:Domain of unknown function (DUF6875)
LNAVADTPQPQDEATALAMTETLDWILRFVMKPHPALGRRGAVCPFMEHVMKRGRFSLHPVRMDRPAHTARLRGVAGDWLRRINPAGPPGEYEAAVFVPVGPEPAVLRDAVVDAQEALRADALRRGCMVGEFYPGHPGQGVRNPGFRPLQAPHSILGIRTMVDTDILFFDAPQASAPDRELTLQVWHRFFGDRAPSTLREVYAHAAGHRMTVAGEA